MLPIQAGGVTRLHIHKKSQRFYMHNITYIDLLLNIHSINAAVCNFEWNMESWCKKDRYYIKIKASFIHTLHYQYFHSGMIKIFTWKSNSKLAFTHTQHFSQRNFQILTSCESHTEPLIALKLSYKGLFFFFYSANFLASLQSACKMD